MKKVIIVLFGAVCLCLLASCQQSSPKVSTLSGKPIPLKANAKFLVINYWASWCKPCYREIPELNAFYKKYKDKGVDVVGVSYDQVKPTPLKKIVKEMGIDFPTLAEDPASLIGIGNIPGLPATYILDRNGKVVKSLYGIQTEKSLIEAMKLS
jgi:thiol-disulfide isomerase/thioredoxin